MIGILPMKSESNRPHCGESHSYTRPIFYFPPRTRGEMQVADYDDDSEPCSYSGPEINNPSQRPTDVPGRDVFPDECIGPY